MDATRFPSLRCVLKQCLKTGSGCRVWETKGFSCGLKIYFEDPHFDLSKVEICLRKGIKIESIK